MDPERFEKVEVRSADDLWAWLEAHYGNADSVWLVTFKAHHVDRYVSRDAVLDALIAWGWIDGRRMKLDADRTMQLIAPRKEQRWAKTYKGRAAKLTQDGRMAAPGLAAIERAKRAGLWDADTAIGALEVPDDLTVLLDANPVAARFFSDAAPSYRRNVLRWIARAKRAETRQQRIETVVAHAARGEKVPQY